ncbi:MAG: hypothetical protein JXR68_10005 [Bacteroidales bacterium]|nr:hypothetical protein [Bacteroidales bacterium]
MKRFLFLLVLMIFSTFLQAQNLVKINDYTQNFNKDVSFRSFILSGDSITVLSKANNGILLSNLDNLSKNSNLLSGFVTDYCQSDKNIYSLQIINQNSFNFLSIKKLSKSFSPEKEANYKLSSSISNIYITCDDENNLFVAGTYSDDFFIDNNNFNRAKGTDVFLIKLNQNLEIINFTSINYDGNEILNDIAFFENKLVLIGAFDENFANQTSLGKSDAFVLILDTDFNVVKNFQYSSI